MGICSWLVFGFFVGLIARAAMPGNNQMGFFKTSVLGIAGSFAGGMLWAMVTRGDPLDFRPVRFVGSVIGALTLLFLGQALRK